MDNFSFCNNKAVPIKEPFDFGEFNVNDKGTKLIKLGKNLAVIVCLVCANIQDCSAKNVFDYEDEYKFIECQNARKSTESYYKDSFQNKLDELACLKRGWDGYDALPIEKRSYKNMKEALTLLNVKQMSHFNLFPNTNGTLILSAKGKYLASINIGNKNFSYFAIGENGQEAKGVSSFTRNAFIKAVKEIGNVLGWD